jgi:REP element-mobilizing transposase RayT
MNRQPLIATEFENRLHDYLAQKSTQMGAHCFAVNGMIDHVHMVVSLPPKLSISEAAKTLKGASAHDFNQMGFTLYWQPGYGVFTCGERQLDIAVAYVNNQKQHHAEKTTNAWLEREAEEDTGPENIAIPPAAVIQALRETSDVYSPVGEPPFSLV